MSRPRGKAIQRKLAQVATDILTPYGFTTELDFTQRGGHQKLRISHPRLKHTMSMDIPCSPRSEGNALDLMRQKTKRLIRDCGLA